MAQAYVPIQTVTVGSGGSASIEFNNIPQNYTDLCLMVSIRLDNSSYDDSFIWFNNDTTAGNYSRRLLYGTGSSALSASATALSLVVANRSNQTASTFSNNFVYIPNYTSSNNKSIFSDGVQENNATAAFQILWAGLWNNTSAITRINITPPGGNLVQYSTATLYGIGGARASGGTITADARYTYHTFTSSGTFIPLEKIKNAEVLCIAGGGAGGGGTGGYGNSGGGGAGGVLSTGGQTFNAGTTYSAVVGAGAAGFVFYSANATGSNSVVSTATSTVTALGGGNGGSGSFPAAAQNAGVAGGSGGGAAVNDGNAYGGGAGTSGQGNAGGNGLYSASAYGGGGGGGAGAAGQTATTSKAGDGGNGTTTYSAWGYATSTGVSSGGMYYYAAGGGGAANGTNTYGNGGIGGGGRGAANSGPTEPLSATANTGSGGGGLGATGYNYPGGNGGSGLVIIRYPN